jgi:hypothetical protein
MAPSSRRERHVGKGDNIMKKDSSSKSDFVDSHNDTLEGISAERISHEDIGLIKKLRAVWMDMSIPKTRLHLENSKRARERTRGRTQSEQPMKKESRLPKPQRGKKRDGHRFPGTRDES